MIHTRRGRGQDDGCAYNDQQQRPKLSLPLHHDLLAKRVGRLRRGTSGDSFDGPQVRGDDFLLTFNRAAALRQNLVHTATAYSHRSDAMGSMFVAGGAAIAQPRNDITDRIRPTGLFALHRDNRIDSRSAPRGKKRRANRHERK
jgi:hypothetical protein